MKLPALAAGLVAEFPALGSAVGFLEMEWAPEEPTITTSMGELGRALAEGAGEAFSTQEVAEVFQRVEQVLTGGSDLEKDAVATGFLEAIATTIDREPERRWILDHAGPGARRYLRDWDRFCGRS